MNNKFSDLNDARVFFSDELKEVIQNQKVEAKKESQDYLANLLVGYMKSSQFFVQESDGSLKNNVLADLYAQYLTGNSQAKRVALQRLGDICLLISGFFSDSLKRKLVDVDYYFGMGGTAYWELSHLQLGDLTRKTYQELSIKFKAFSSVLEEISERTGITSNSDILRIYEKWLVTGNERLKKLLAQHGISSPIDLDINSRH